MSLLLLLSAAGAFAQDVTSTLYVRTDTDHTTVVTPRIHAGAKVGPATRVDLTYSADVWTSASIDIRSSASKAVTEQRDELNVGATQQIEDGTLSASYRFSTEPDYKSHGVTLGTSRDFAQKNTTLALTGSALFDRVGRAAVHRRQPAHAAEAHPRVGDIADVDVCHDDAVARLDAATVRHEHGHRRVVGLAAHSSPSLP